MEKECKYTLVSDGLGTNTLMNRFSCEIRMCYRIKYSYTDLAATEYALCEFVYFV